MVAKRPLGAKDPPDERDYPFCEIVRKMMQDRKGEDAVKRAELVAIDPCEI